MSRFLVIGAGAVGASIAAELHRAGLDTVLIARGEHLAVLRERGLTYARPDGELRLRIPVAAGPAEVDLTEDDVLLLATKSPDTAAAVRDWAWQPVKRADGATGIAATELPLVTIQNGLDNERTALRSFANVIGAVVWIPATFVVPGEVINHGHPVPAVLWLGHYPAGPASAGPASAAAASTGPDSATDRIAAELRRATLAVHVIDDIVAHKAAKLLGNLGNGLGALYPPSELRDAAVLLLRDEARAVYAAAGIVPATPDRGDFGLADVPGRKRFGSSTWQSLARATPTEIDYLSGEIVLLGRLHGVDTPGNAAIQARLHRAAVDGTPAGSLDDSDLAATLPAAITLAARSDTPSVVTGGRP